MRRASRAKFYIATLRANAAERTISPLLLPPPPPPPYEKWIDAPGIMHFKKKGSM